MVRLVVVTCAETVKERRATGERDENNYPIEELVDVPCGAEVDRIEVEDDFAEEGEKLVTAVVKRKVKDRPDDTYTCPNGHSGKLEVAE